VEDKAHGTASGCSSTGLHNAEITARLKGMLLRRSQQLCPWGFRELGQSFVLARTLFRIRHGT
jgi:hypothetical protein